MNPLRTLFSAVLDRAGPERARGLKLKAFWPTIAGPMLASKARAELLGREVVLRVEDPRWLREVQGMARALAGRLDAAIGGVDRVVAIAEPKAASPVDAFANTAMPAAPPPDPGVASALRGVADPALRARLEAAAAAYLAGARSRGRT